MVCLMGFILDLPKVGTTAHVLSKDLKLGSRQTIHLKCVDCWIFLFPWLLVVIRSSFKSKWHIQQVMVALACCVFLFNWRGWLFTRSNTLPFQYWVLLDGCADIRLESLNRRDSEVILRHWFNFIRQSEGVPAFILWSVILVDFHNVKALYKLSVHLF